MKVTHLLPPYDESAKCAKCGSPDVFTAYHRCGYDCGFNHRVSDGEHMHRGCRRCGFHWPESTIEAAERQGEGG